MICKAFANHSTANLKFSKAQLPKMVQFGGFYVNFLDHY